VGGSEVDLSWDGRVLGTRFCDVLKNAGLYVDASACTKKMNEESGSFEKRFDISAVPWNGEIKDNKITIYPSASGKQLRLRTQVTLRISVERITPFPAKYEDREIYYVGTIKSNFAMDSSAELDAAGKVPLTITSKTSAVVLTGGTKSNTPGYVGRMISTDFAFKYQKGLNEKEIYTSFDLFSVKKFSSDRLLGQMRVPLSSCKFADEGEVPITLPLTNVKDTLGSPTVRFICTKISQTDVQH